MERAVFGQLMNVRSLTGADSPSRLATCALLIKLFRDCPCIRVDLCNHVKGLVDFDDASNISLFYVSSWLKVRSSEEKTWYILELDPDL